MPSTLPTYISPRTSNPGARLGPLPSGGRQALTSLANTALNRQPRPLDPRLDELLGKATSLFGTSQGLSPEALTSLRQESTSGLQNRYNAAASNIKTNLQQRGAYGRGELPSDPGEILRSFGPLESDMAQALSKASRDTILADEEAKRASLLSNNQTAMNALGIGTDIWGQQNQIDMEALRTAIQAAGGAAELEPTPLGNIVTASLLGAGSKLLTDPAALKQIGKWLGIGGGAGAAALGGAANTAAGAAAAGMAPTLSALGEGAVGPVAANFGGAAAAAPGGLSAAITGFFTNPITIGVGAALAGAYLWKRSQVHPTADKFVQEFQNPFGGHLTKSVDAFYQAIQGGVDTATAESMYQEIVNLIQEFEDDRTEFSKKGKKEETVAGQALDTMEQNFGEGYSKLLGDMAEAIRQHTRAA